MEQIFGTFYSVHGIHGRSLPVAVGTKLSNKDLTVIADTGDGDSYGEGIAHLIGTARSNIDVTFLVHDNHLYSLTKGQMSPTTNKGTKTKSTPFGSLNRPLNPLAVALVNGATFVGQAFSGDIPGMTELIKKAVKHRGFAILNILQICPTFNKVNTFDWYKERIFKINETDHDTSSFGKALAASIGNNEKLPVGVLYQVEKETYSDQLPQLEDEPLVKMPIDNVDISESLKAYK